MHCTIAGLPDQAGTRTQSVDVRAARAGPGRKSAENVSKPAGSCEGRQPGKRAAGAGKTTEPEASAADTWASSCECTIKSALVIVCVIKAAVSEQRTVCRQRAFAGNDLYQAIALWRGHDAAAGFPRGKFLRWINGRCDSAVIVVRFPRRVAMSLHDGLHPAVPAGLPGGSAAAARIAARYPALPGASGDFDGHRPGERNNHCSETTPGCSAVRLAVPPVTPQAAQRA